MECAAKCEKSKSDLLAGNQTRAEGISSSVVLATSELRKRPGNSDVDNASRDCFWGRAFCLRPLKQSHDALSTSLLPGLLRNSEVANTE